MQIPTPRSALALLAAAALASTLVACGDVSGPGDAAPAKATLTPARAHADGTPVDTTQRNPVQPWY